jgi:hypothetical protein
MIAHRVHQRQSDHSYARYHFLDRITILTACPYEFCFGPVTEKQDGNQRELTDVHLGSAFLELI